MPGASLAQSSHTGVTNIFGNPYAQQVEKTRFSMKTFVVVLLNISLVELSYTFEPIIGHLFWFTFDTVFTLKSVSNTQNCIHSKVYQIMIENLNHI